MSDRSADSASGALNDLSIWLSGSPWRLAAGWAVLAGLSATAGQHLGAVPLAPLLLAVLLADAAWGAVWRQIAERAAAPEPAASGALVRLPYANPRGIAGQAGWLPHALRSWLPAVVLAGALAWAVGAGALALTATVVALALVGWVLYRVAQEGAARWLHGLALIAAPFALGVWLAPDAPLWPETGQLSALGVGAVLLFRAGLAAGAGEAHVLLLAGAGSLLIVALLLWAGQPLAAGLAAAGAAAPLLLLSQAARHAPRLAVLHAWWWLLIVGVALALGFGIG